MSICSSGEILKLSDLTDLPSEWHDIVTSEILKACFLCCNSAIWQSIIFKLHIDLPAKIKMLMQESRGAPAKKPAPDYFLWDQVLVVFKVTENRINTHYPGWRCCILKPVSTIRMEMDTSKGKQSPFCRFRGGPESQFCLLRWCPKGHWLFETTVCAPAMCWVTENRTNFFLFSFSSFPQ